jgi:hypothetical protein
MLMHRRAPIEVYADESAQLLYRFVDDCDSIVMIRQSMNALVEWPMMRSVFDA